MYLNVHMIIRSSALKINFATYWLFSEMFVQRSEFLYKNQKKITIEDCDDSSVMDDYFYFQPLHI